MSSRPGFPVYCLPRLQLFPYHPLCRPVAAQRNSPWAPLLYPRVSQGCSGPSYGATAAVTCSNSLVTRLRGAAARPASHLLPPAPTRVTPPQPQRYFRHAARAD